VVTDARADAAPDAPPVLDGSSNHADASPPEAGPAVTTLRNALLGAWALDANGQDHSGNGANLDVTEHEFVAGQFGLGVRVASQDSGLPAVIQPGTGADRLATGVGINDFTVATWVLVTEPRERFWAIVQGAGQGAGYPGWGVGTTGSGWVFGHSAIDMTVVGRPVDLGRFYHVLMTRNGPTLRMFVDGVAIKAVQVTYPETPPLSNAMLVGTGPGLGENGVIDDIAIWDRQLTDDERAYLLTNPVPTH